VGSSNVLSPEFCAAHGGPAKWCSLRPEKINLTPKGIKAKVTAINYQGAVTRLAVDVEGTRIIAALPTSDVQHVIGDVVHISWSRDSLAEMDDA
jgi:putative spermidine/putrescine transport system ATP-binding protein